MVKKKQGQVNLSKAKNLAAMIMEDVALSQLNNTALKMQRIMRNEKASINAIRKDFGVDVQTGERMREPSLLTIKTIPDLKRLVGLL